ncbi:MAG TPA: glycosyltransferase family 4 protein [Planctomycetota bacterium]|nr:glycosyltransferase family 4 protein [Planctomycetota bacterium]
MKVLHVNTERTWRGGEQQVLYLAKGLAARGVEQEILCQQNSVLAARARDAGLLVWERRLHGEVDLPSMRAMADRLREGRFDLIHMHTSHAHTLGLVAARLAGRRRPGDRPATLVSRRVDFSIRKRRLLDFSHLKYTWGLDRIVCVSEMIRAVLLRDGLPPELVGVVHSGVDVARLQGAPDRRADYRREFGVPAGAPLVATVGHCAEHKGQRFLVAAAPAVLERFPEARILVVGEGELLPDLKEQARALHVEGRVLFPGFRTDVPALLRAFDLFVFPSHLEGLGTSVLDALAVGLPVVATTAGGIPEMITDGVHGRLVPPRDPAALAAAMIELLEQPERARQMGEAGRARVMAEFTAERMVEKTLLEYERLAGARVGAA